MKADQFTHSNSRREFIKKIALTSTVAALGFGGIFKIANAHSFFSNPKDFQYKYSTMSVKHLSEIKKWYEKLSDEGKMSNSKFFRSDLHFQYDVNKIIPNSKSIIIISIPERIAKIICHIEDQQYEILIPTGYVDDSVTEYMVKRRLMDEIIQDHSKRIEWIYLPLKTIAVRSGLAKYGKNNIAYVDKYGSNHRLKGYVTNMELNDNWGSLKLLRDCKGCTICIKECPNGCFRDDNFVIDVGKCLTLYNYPNQAIPEWMDPKIHHTMIGCLKCQLNCPANEKSNQNVITLAELTKEETEFIWGDSMDTEMHQYLIEKLHHFHYTRNLNYFRKNFKLAINSQMGA